MLLEASRLGASVQGVDVEPVAAAIAGFQTKLRGLPDLTATLDSLINTVGRTVAPYYEAADGETLVHAFWVQTVQCGECKAEFDAHPKLRFAWDEATSRQWVDHLGLYIVGRQACPVSRVGSVDEPLLVG